MLGAISSQLPDIGYTVAIGMVYYVYIGLSALLTIAVERNYKAMRIARVQMLDRIIRIDYPIAIAAVIGLS